VLSGQLLTAHSLCCNGNSGIAAYMVRAGTSTLPGIFEKLGASVGKRSRK
jgi:hypothetical protein